jgi:hypothetical protein
VPVCSSASAYDFWTYDPKKVTTLRILARTLGLRVENRNSDLCIGFEAFTAVNMKMWWYVGLVRTNDSEECDASTFSVEIIGARVTTLAVPSATFQKTAIFLDRKTQDPSGNSSSDLFQTEPFPESPIIPFRILDSMRGLRLWKLAISYLFVYIQYTSAPIHKNY